MLIEYLNLNFLDYYELPEDRRYVVNYQRDGGSVDKSASPINPRTHLGTF